MWYKVTENLNLRKKMIPIESTLHETLSRWWSFSLTRYLCYCRDDTGNYAVIEKVGIP